MLKVNVIGAKRYSFNDRESGRLVEGVNVFYTRPADGSDEIGEVTQKVTLPIDTFPKIKSFKFPANCEVVLEQKLSSKGVVSKPVDLKLIS